MTAVQVSYVVCHCYPSEDGPFLRYAGAVVGCWVREEHPDPARVARKRIEAAGWHVTATEPVKCVSAASYAGNAIELGFLEQSIIDGFVANFHVYDREFISIHDVDRGWTAKEIVASAAALKRQAFSLYSEADSQWANGVSPSGNEFVPIWNSADTVKSWLASWRGYELRSLAPGKLCDITFEADVRSMLVGLGVGDSLITCHPLWLRDITSRE